MGIIRTADRSPNSREVGFQLRSSGVVKQPGAAPQYVGGGILSTAAGPGAFLSGSASVLWPSPGTVKGDLGILVVESAGDDATVAPTGWTHVTGSPIVDVASSAGSKLSVLWKFAEASTIDSPGPADADDSVTSIDNHLIARIFSFRGVRTDVAPGRVSATDTKVSASTTCTFPSITTPYDNCLVVMVGTDPTDTSTSSFSGHTNANLTSITERGESHSTVGNGGGFVVVSGIKAAAGSTGTTTSTITNNVTNAVITLALEPAMAILP